MNEIFKATTSKDFFSIIPKDIEKNIEFRKLLHSTLVGDKGFQKTFLELCRIDPRIFFNAVAFTLDPRNETGYRNLPFILRPKQEVALLKVKECVRDGKDIVIDKSREEGATEILMKYSALEFLLVPDTVILWGSRSEDLVDKTGDPSTLFAKIDYTFARLPNWWKALLNIERNFKHFKNLNNNATIDGEATSEHFGAGKRATFVGLDEFGQVEPNIAQSIEFNVSDVSNCIIYNSTHFYGTGHSFYRLLRRKNIEVVKLLWYDNPAKRGGLYRSPRLDEIEILDKEYYNKRWSEVFGSMDLSIPLKYSEFHKKYKEPVFIPDGMEKSPIILRSPWHDKEEEERDYRNLCQNVWAYPVGAAGMYFDSFINDKIRTSYIKQPSYEGELRYDIKDKKVVNPVFKQGYGKKLFKLWCPLFKDHPNPLHNYIIGCDIGFGTGASNSTAMIVDVNSCEQIGEFVSSTLMPDEFAEMVVAIAKWIGGASGTPFLIWENNGGQGINFGRRVIEQGVSLVYTETTEDSKTRTRRKKWGWTNNRRTKDDVLMGLKMALKEGLKEGKAHRSLIVHSEELVNELDSYIFYDSGEVDSSEDIDLNSGARARHGDRVIGIALCVLGMKDQAAMKKIVDGKIPWGSYAWRKKQRERIDAMKKDTWKEPDTLKRGWK